MRFSYKKYFFVKINESKFGMKTPMGMTNYSKLSKMPLLIVIFPYKILFLLGFLLIRDTSLHLNTINKNIFILIFISFNFHSFLFLLYLNKVLDDQLQPISIKQHLLQSWATKSRENIQNSLMCVSQ